MLCTDSEGLAALVLSSEVDAFLSPGYLWGLHFWMLDKPIGFGVTCNSASRAGIALSPTD